MCAYTYVKVCCTTNQNERNSKIYLTHYEIYNKKYTKKCMIKQKL